MPYIRSVSIDTEKTNPFPYNVPAVKFTKNIDLDNSINFFVGDNGTGKSTLIEAIAFRLQLPHMDGADYPKRSFQGAIKLSPFLQIDYKIERPIGFFFRAEDFGDYMNSVHRRGATIKQQLDDLEGEVPEQVISEMIDNANYQIHHMRKNYGEELSAFSHGEAYLKIIQEKVSKRGIYILDEPEAALSPTKQLSLIYHIKEHLKTNMSQFIIATHSPILMAIPGSNLYEITEDEMVQKSYVDTEHYMVTKGFLNNPDLYLNYLDE